MGSTPNLSSTSTSSAAPSVGRVKFFNEERAFGFIRSDSGETIFVHGSNVHGGILAAEDRVEFVVGTNRKNGKPEAKRVRVLRIDSRGAQ